MDQHREVPTQAALDRWEAAGLISAEQHRAICAFEVARPSGTQVPEESNEGLSLLAELSTYLGMVLVLASGALATSRLWQVLGAPGRAVIGLVVVVLSLFASRMLQGELAPSLSRLRNVVQACGASGAAMTTAVLADAADGHVATTTVMVTGLVTALINGSLWRNRERTLALVGTVVGVSMMVASFVAALNWRLSSLLVGLLLIALGGTFVVAAQRVLRPTVALTMLSQLAMFVGSAMVINGHGLFAFALGLLTSAIGVGVGLQSKALPATAVGLFGFAFFTIRLLAMYVQGPLTIVITFGVGVALVLVVLKKGLASKRVTSSQ